MKPTHRGRRLVLMATICAFGLTACSADEAGSGVAGSLTAIGSSSQNGPLSAWQQGWSKDFPGTSMRYSPDGDAIGRDALFRGMAHFASIDSQLTPEDWEKSKQACGASGAFAVPTSVTAIGVSYNVAGLRSVRLDPDTLTAMFDGAITRWDDSRIAALNPETDLPDLEVVPVWAKNDSGLTHAAGEYLASGMGGGMDIDRTWPDGTAGESVASYSDLARKVDDTAGAVSFMDRAEIGTRFSTATLKFGDEFVNATNDALTTAVESGDVKGAPGGGVQLNLHPGASPGYSLGFVGYHAFCHTYQNEALTRLVRSWAFYVNGDGGQANSTYFAQVGSPSVEALKQSKSALESIKAADNVNQ